MKLVFAQGNPGSRYERTRHNAGFIVIDSIVAKHGGSWKSENKFNADVATITIDGEKILFIKPLSFYNETGRVARSIVDFYKLSPSTDVLVLHDELALPFGTVRVREKGSDAGNNGIKSLNAHLGPEYWRIRVGVWNERKEVMGDVDFVLSTFSPSETTALAKAITDTVDKLIYTFVDGSIENTSQSH